MAFNRINIVNQMWLHVNSPIKTKGTIPLPFVAGLCFVRILRSTANFPVLDRPSHVPPSLPGVRSMAKICKEWILFCKPLGFMLRVVLLLYVTVKLGRVAQSVGHLTRKSGVLGSMPGLVTYFRFSFRFFKKGSCQLLAKVCARSTG